MPAITKEYYHDIDLNKNQLLNSRLQNLTTAARIVLGGTLGAADAGLIVYDTSLLFPYIWNGTAWSTLTPSVTWGSITGTITSQTDLITYLSTNYYPLSSNPANYIDLTDLSAGTGISYNNLTGVITNSAPDQTVSIGTTGSGLSVTGSYPSFTLQNTLPDQTVSLSSGTGISVSGTYPNFTITNTSPSSGGTVTSIATSAPITGGTITTTGTIGITQATALTDGYLSSVDWTTFNNKQSAISLTTTGTSGAATFIANTLNIPQYQAALTNPVTGTGTATRVAFWDTSSSISSDSALYWDNSNKRLGVGTATPAYKLDVNGDESIQGYLNLKPSAAPTSIRIASNDVLNGGSSSNNVDRLVLIGNNVATNLSLKTINQGDSLIGIGFGAANSTTTGGIYSVHIGRSSGAGITTGAYNTHIGSGDAVNIPSTTRSSIHIVAAGGYSNNDAASVLTGLTSRYAFIGGGFSSAEYINNFYLGAGPFVTDPNLANLAIFAPSGVGTDLQGANFTFNAGRGTGSGTPGDLIFQTSTTGSSGTTLQTLSQRVKIAGQTGDVTINNLSGVGTRMVVADAAGGLSTQTIPAGGNVSGTGVSGQVAFWNGTTTQTGSNNLFWDDANGRLGINTATPSTALNIVGATQTGSSAVGALDISQTWNTTGTPTAIKLNVTDTASNALSNFATFQIGGTNRFIFRKDSALHFGANVAAPAIAAANAASGGSLVGGLALGINGTLQSNAGYSVFIQNGTGTRAVTGGTSGACRITETFNPASGGGTYDILTLASTINQTGGANGTSRGLYVNPTLTAAADWRAIETTAGQLRMSDTYAAGSGSLAGSLLDLSQTWNTTGTPTAIKLNVTNTASSGVGRLLDLQIGGVSQFFVDRFGAATGRTITSSVVGTTNAFVTSRGSGTSGSSFIVTQSSGSINTSGAIDVVSIEAGLAPTSGTATHTHLLLKGTINQTGGANGITRGLYVNPTLTSAADWRSIEWSNNSGWGLYGVGTAPNYLAGSLGIGTVSLGNSNLRITKQITGATSVNSVVHESNVGSGVTSAAGCFVSTTTASNASFTLGNLRHFWVAPDVKPVAATITNEFGFVAGSSLVNGTNNYGFYGDIASGSNRWNLYMNGTANNYLAGNLSIGTTSTTNALNIVGATQTGSSADGAVSISQTWNTTGTPSAIKLNVTNTASNAGLLMQLQVGGANRFRFSNTANLHFGTNDNTYIGPASGAGSGDTGGTSLRYFGNNAGVSGYDHHFSNISNRSYTSGNGGVLNVIGQNYQVTSGTGIFNHTRLAPLINQTGTSSGITRGLFIEPTLTNAVDFRGIEVTNGSIVLPYTGQSATYAIKTSDYLIDCTTGTFTVTLPTAVGATGKVYKIVNSGSGTITIATTSSQTFVNIAATPTTLTLGAVGAAAIVMYEVISNGANWIVTGKVKNE